MRGDDILAIGDDILVVGDDVIPAGGPDSFAIRVSKQQVTRATKIIRPECSSGQIMDGPQNLRKTCQQVIP